MADRIAVVGAGLVGSLWATLLRREGYEVDVFERRADPRRAGADAGRSINLVMTSRGLHGLDSAGLLGRGIELAVPVYGRMIHGRDSSQVYQPYGRANECNHSISRAELNRFLIDEAEAAGARLHFSHELEALNLTESRAVFKTPTGPVTRAFSVLFGADGAGSRVRQALVAREPARFQENISWLEADYKELTWPLDPSGRYNLRKDALHIWPRGTHMMMALANLDGGFTMTIYLPREGDGFSFANLRDRAAVKRLFDSEFPDAREGMPNAVDEFLANPQGRLGTVRVSNWVTSNDTPARVALLGDAAHAIVPFFGQGMNSGFEDCTTLLSLLREQPGDWRWILAQFDRHQRPNADAIADMALENWAEMRDRVGDPKFLLRKKVEAALEERHPGAYKSRYGLITYTLVPYATAQKIGRAQEEFLTRLCERAETLDGIDWDAADAWVRGELQRNFGSLVMEVQA